MLPYHNKSIVLSQIEICNHILQSLRLTWEFTKHQIKHESHEVKKTYLTTYLKEYNFQWIMKELYLALHNDNYNLVKLKRKELYVVATDCLQLLLEAETPEDIYVNRCDDTKENLQFVDKLIRSSVH